MLWDLLGGSWRLYQGCKRDASEKENTYDLQYGSESNSFSHHSDCKAGECKFQSVIIEEVVLRVYCSGEEFKVRFFP